MSANIEQFSDGTAAFFSNRVPAWHKLGIVTDGAQTAKQAIKVAQLDWEVFKSDNPVGVHLLDTNGREVDEYVTATDKFLTYRYHPKTKKPQALGVVGNRYTPVQNIEAFDFLTAIADESGAVFETAGALGKGERVFVSMKMPNGILIGGQDALDLYLLAWNTHDGSSSFQVVTTAIRVVCQNTLTMALAGAKNTVALRHTTGVTGKVQQARETLGVTFKYVEAFEKEAELLISQSMTDKAFEKMVEALLPKPTTVTGKDRSNDAREIITALWKAPTQANIANTKWAAYNAVAEYVDWAAPVREKKGVDARAVRTITGRDGALKKKVLTLLK